MQALRAFISRHRRLAAMLVICALAIKAAVPAGYMLSQTGQVLTIAICADASGSTLTRQIVVPVSGAHDPAKAPAHDPAHDKASATCPYAALGFAALAGADTLLLALALAFILALGFARVPPAPARRTPFLRPPLRGPPAHA